MKITKKNVEDANIKFFTANAENYNKEEPTYLPENKSRVRKILKNIGKKSPGSLLDVGCGTGFVLDLAYPYFDRLFGIDLTQAMLDEVNLRGGKVKVTKGNSEKIPYDDNQFNVCTSYGFLHHLYRLKPTLKEIHRCLKKGGIFYSDQDPNYYFWKFLSTADIKKIDADFIKKEVFDKVGNFDESLRIVADLDLFFRIKKTGYTFHYINQALTHFELGGISTQQYEKTHQEIIEVCKRYGVSRLASKMEQLHYALSKAKRFLKR